MKKIYKIGILVIGFMLITGLVYATVTVASDRKSSKLPWQGTPDGYYDSAHNVGDSYITESRFSFATGSIAGGDSVIYDSITKLYWQSNGNADGAKTWESAKTYCADLELGGYTDWKLPNLKELESIVDFNINDPSIDDTTYFKTESSYYWSSTTYVSDISSACLISFRRGESYYRDKTDTCYVRCVR